MSYKAHNRVLLSASLLVILVAVMITITEGADFRTKTDDPIEMCVDTASSDPSIVAAGSSDQNCQGQLSTPEFLTILVVGLGLAGIGFAVRRLSSGSPTH